MTGQPYDDDDAQFDAFLQGKGPLAQGLAELTQPEPPAALDAAILARVAADLEHSGAAGNQPGGAAAAAPVPPASAVAPSGTAAANDSPADFRPRRWAERWRVPVGLAAGVTAISIALPLWQEEVAQQQQTVHTAMQEMQIPAVPAPPVEPVAPPASAAAAPEMATPAKDAAAAAAGRAAARTPAAMAAMTAPSGQAAKAEAARADTEAKKRKADDAGLERQAMERDMAESRARASQAGPVADVPAPRVAMPAPAAAPAPATPPPPPTPAPAPAYGRSPALGATQPSPLPAPQIDYRTAPPVQYAPPEAKPALAKQLADDAASQPTSPAAIVARIEQLLKEGRRDEALAEWERLRASYPDYPVPDRLREALGRSR